MLFLVYIGESKLISCSGGGSCCYWHHGSSYYCYHRVVARGASTSDGLRLISDRGELSKLGHLIKTKEISGNGRANEAMGRKQNQLPDGKILVLWWL